MLPRPGVGKIVNISSNGACRFEVFGPPAFSQKDRQESANNLDRILAMRIQSECRVDVSLTPRRVHRA